MARTPEEQANLDLVLEMYREVLIAMNPDKVDSYLSPNYVQHSSLAEPGLDALKAFLARVRVESPDAAQTIHRALVDGDHVAVSCPCDPVARRSRSGGRGHIPVRKRCNCRTLGRDPGSSGACNQSQPHVLRRNDMRFALYVIAGLACIAAPPAEAAACRLKPKQVATAFMTKFYVDKKVREAFETWVDPGYIQHNPLAATGRDAAIGFLEPFFLGNPGISYSIKRVIADQNLVAIHSHARFSAEDRGMAVVDILRIQGCKVMEHWDVLQPVPEKSANSNGMF